MSRPAGPCLCGDPECGRCFPRQARAAADLGPLFDTPPRTRRTDPMTSYAAAVTVAPHVRSQRAAVLAALRQYGPMTYKDVDRALGWHTGAQRRLVELQRAGLAMLAGGVADGCRVWQATPGWMPQAVERARLSRPEEAA